MIEVKRYVHEFVHKYLDVSIEKEHWIVDYALSTWIPLPTQVKYLQFVYSVGTGSTRALSIMKHICKNPVIAQNGISSTASIAYLMDKSYPCTLISDEVNCAMEPQVDDDGNVADDPFITILLAGANKNTGWLGYANEGGSVFLNIFGRKVIASNSRFADPALASKCLVIDLKPKKILRLDIPVTLDFHEFQKDGERIQKILSGYFAEVM